MLSNQTIGNTSFEDVGELGFQLKERQLYEKDLSGDPIKTVSVVEVVDELKEGDFLDAMECYRRGMLRVNSKSIQIKQEVEERTIEMIFKGEGPFGLTIKKVIFRDQSRRISSIALIAEDIRSARAIDSWISPEYSTSKYPTFNHLFLLGCFDQQDSLSLDSTATSQFDIALETISAGVPSKLFFDYSIRIGLPQFGVLGHWMENKQTLEEGQQRYYFGKYNPSEITKEALEAKYSINDSTQRWIVDNKQELVRYCGIPHPLAVVLYEMYIKAFTGSNQRSSHNFETTEGDFFSLLEGNSGFTWVVQDKDTATPSSFLHSTTPEKVSWLNPEKKWDKETKPSLYIRTTVSTSAVAPSVFLTIFKTQIPDGGIIACDMGERISAPRQTQVLSRQFGLPRGSVEIYDAEQYCSIGIPVAKA